MISGKKIIFFLILVLVFEEFSFAQTARQLNVEGYRLYKQKQYAKALDKFRESVEKDSNYALAHYNLACTLGILRKKGYVCDYEAYVGTILFHLKKSVKLDPGRARRMLTDSDLEVVHNTVAYQVLSGLDPARTDDLRKILIKVSWLGPSPGVYGHLSGVDFRVDGTFEAWELSFSEEGEVNKIYWKGDWKIKGTIIELKLKKPRNNKQIFKGKLKGSVLKFDGFLSNFSDEPDECGA